MEYSSAIKKNELLLQATAWMNLEWNLLNNRRHPKLSLISNPAEQWCPRILSWKPPVTLSLRCSLLKMPLCTEPLPFSRALRQMRVHWLSPKLHLGGGSESLRGNLPFNYGNNFSFFPMVFLFSDPTLPSDISIETPTISSLFLPAQGSGRTFVFFLVGFLC